MPIRLIALDLDGTVLTSDRSPHPLMASALARATDRGIVLCFASGRTVASIRVFARELGVSVPMVGCNGAYSVRADGRELHHEPVPDFVRDRVLDYADEAGIHVNLYSRDEVLYPEASPWNDLYLSRVKNLEPRQVSRETMRQTSVTKLLLIDDPERIQRHLTYLRTQVSPDEGAVTISEPEYLEFLPPRVNKGFAVAKVAEDLGIAQAEVAAMGDYLNDLEMLEWAGVSAAPANAAAPILRLVDRSFSSNNEGGAAEFVDWIVSNE
ncbi:MAG TPA: Cof-type HAD-IIB family hydrolase [Fimbriimonadaceae bacterium]|nr:Cof-type HAD-IIB family hydrolase [Fimbriimonadaceae bacterium]